MAAFADGIFQAVLATFLFMVPAISLQLLVGGLADPRKDTWGMPPDAERWKTWYRMGATWMRANNRVLIALFLVQMVAMVTLRSAGCDTQASHLSAAAWNLAFIADRVFFFALVTMGAFALAGLGWGATYLVLATRHGWTDPNRRDALVVHLFLVPLSLLLMGVAFGVLPNMVCPFVITP